MAISFSMFLYEEKMYAGTAGVSLLTRPFLEATALTLSLVSLSDLFLCAYVALPISKSA